MIDVKFLLLVPANSNRLRLLRLSEAAENLRKQAAVNVQTGKVNDARELLFQKKKVMQALDKAKARIELLDTLSSKLNEVRRNQRCYLSISGSNHVLRSLVLVWFQAISVKEAQLIGNISLDPEIDRDYASGGVHIVSPKLDSTGDEQENDPLGLDSHDSKLIEEETLDTDNHLLEDASTGIDFREVSSYESFLENVDQKLGRIEAELVTLVNVASLVLNHEDKPKNLKVQQTAEILEEIRSVRERYCIQRITKFYFYSLQCYLVYEVYCFAFVELQISFAKRQQTPVSEYMKPLL